MLRDMDFGQRLKALGLVYGSSVYAFGTMVLLFLVGVSLGSAVQVGGSGVVVSTVTVGVAGSTVAVGAVFCAKCSAKI